MANRSIQTLFCFILSLHSTWVFADSLAQKGSGYLPAPGLITTVAGSGAKTNNGSEGAFNEVNIGQTFGVELGPDGALYICEVENHRVWRLDVDRRQAKVVAGNGNFGYTGDGGPAIKASLNQPYEVRFDERGNMYVVEMMNHLVRRIDSATQQVSTVAGTGTAGFSGDGGAATKAQLRRPHSIAIYRNRLFIADIGNHRIREVDLETGLISTLVGNGEKRLPTEGVVQNSPMLGPRALFVSGDDLWIALREGHSVWRLNLTSRNLSHVAGSGKKGFAGDLGPPKLAKFNGPKGIAVDHVTGRVYLVDTENQVIRCIDQRRGLVSTVAGNLKKRGMGGDDGAATEASMDRPHGVCVDPRRGLIYIGDTNNHRVRAVRYAAGRFAKPQEKSP